MDSIDNFLFRRIPNNQKESFRILHLDWAMLWMVLDRLRSRLVGAMRVVGALYGSLPLRGKRVA